MIEKCPHCGSAEGVYTKTTLVNVPYYFSFHGDDQFNGEMYDNAEDLRGGRLAYCTSCDKVVCRMSTLERQWRKKRNEMLSD